MQSCVLGEKKTPKQYNEKLKKMLTLVICPRKGLDKTSEAEGRSHGCFDIIALK